MWWIWWYWCVVGNRKQADAQDGYIGEPGRAGSLRNDTFDDVLTALAMIYLFIIACCKIYVPKDLLQSFRSHVSLGIISSSSQQPLRQRWKSQDYENDAMKEQYWKFGIDRFNFHELSLCKHATQTLARSQSTQQSVKSVTITTKRSCAIAGTVVGRSILYALLRCI